MNLSEALDAALPEIPQARLTRTRPPRLDPDLIVRDDELDGEPIVGVFQRDRSNYFRFSPGQWKLLQLFDGARSYKEIASGFNEQTGESVAEPEVRMFADNLEEANFWYKSPQEKNIAMNQRIAAERGRRAKSKSTVNLAHISFSAWDPDRYLGWLDGKIGRFIYNPWSALAAVSLFAFEGSVFIGRWGTLGPDMEVFYNFTHKGLGDFVMFWLLVLVLGFIHESSHGLTCKHYGGQVHSMGFMFLYLAPAFCVDVTEIWISATKIQRLATIIAGIWIESIICGLAMIVWVNTLAGQWIHDIAYQVILLTGVAVVVINLNPLIKLDGYYFMTEVIGIPDLKERSTAYLTGWFQRRVLRLPIETIAVPRRRAPFFIIYAVLSGTYSYLLLLFVVRLSYNVFSHWLAEFALIPSGLLAFAMFRSRLRSLRKVIVEVWEVKLKPGNLWRPRNLVAAALLGAFLCVPLWRDREDAWFVVEPGLENTVHAAIPGKVDAVMVRQGDTVRAGEPLMRMTSLMAAGMQSSAFAQARNARFETVTAEIAGKSIGSAAAEQNASRRFSMLADEAESSLVIRAPADGTVLTEDPGALLDQSVSTGETLLSLAGGGRRMVRIYVPVSAMDRIRPGAEVALELPGRFSLVRAKLGPLGGETVNLPDGLVGKQKYQGIKQPIYYSCRMPLPESAGDPGFGAAGEAEVFGVRRSVAGRVLTVVANLVKAHFW